MKVTILLFGQLTDIAGTDTITMEDIGDTDSVLASLQKRYPALAASKYVTAVDKNIISRNTLLQDNSTIALLPPFSGG
ncbi:MAG: MoaD/ThiS family protein [Ferruginibacter sp.]